MAEQRQPFRFRLPWQTSRSAPEIQAPAQPTTTIPTQQPTFRPAGIAPPNPPSKAQTTARTEPQPSPSSRASKESRVASQPASPSRAAQTRATSVPPETRAKSKPESPSRTNQTRAASVPPPESRVNSQAMSPSHTKTQTPVPSPTRSTRSASRAATQSRAASVTSYPSRTAPTQPAKQASPLPRLPSRLAPQSTRQTSSQPSSPMRKAIQVEPIDEAVSQSLSPPKKSEPSTKETSQSPLSNAHSLSSLSEEKETKYNSQPPLTHPLSSASQEEESKPAASQQLPQEPQNKTEIASEPQYQTGGETTLKPEMAATQPVQILVPTSSVNERAPAAADAKQESISIAAGHPRSLTESEKKMKGVEGKKDTEEIVKEAKPEDEKEVARELVKEEKTDSSADEKTPKTITDLITTPTDLEKPSKEFPDSKTKTEKMKQKKHETFVVKKLLATSRSDEEHINTVSSTHGKDRNILGNHQKPDTHSGEGAPLHKEIKEEMSKFVHKLATGHSKQPIVDRPVSIITVAGENRGASMQLGVESAIKDESVPIHRGYKLKSDEIPGTTTDGEESSKGRRPRDAAASENNQATRAYVNSNIQSIDNSIMFNSSVNERNPGVHLVFSHNLAEPTRPTTKPLTPETHKAIVSVTPLEKQTYQPTVRRRCLRGLFMEPSDSDPDNPKKPRRHGCLYNCGEKSKDKDMGVL